MNTKQLLNPIMVIIVILILGSILQGCTFGLRRETSIIYASIAAEPECVKGMLRIATNRRIPVTVMAGDESYTTALNLGGYYVISASDLKTLISHVPGEGEGTGREDKP